eukprot:6180330-Pleurochrysis_carterae.AAC.1
MSHAQGCIHIQTRRPRGTTCRETESEAESLKIAMQWHVCGSDTAILFPRSPHGQVCNLAQLDFNCVKTSIWTTSSTALRLAVAAHGAERQQRRDGRSCKLSAHACSICTLLAHY